MPESQRQSCLIPHLALVGAAALWGGSFLATKVGMADAGPFAFVALRFAAATLVLAVVFPAAVRRVTRAELLAGGLVATFAMGGYATQALALQDTSSARVAFLSALYVPLVPVLQLILFREAPALRVWLGVAIGLVGVAAMSGAATSVLAPTTADALSLASAVAIAVEVVLIGRFVAKADPMRLAIVTVAVTAVLAAMLAVATGEPMPRPSPSLAWIVVGFGAASAYIQAAMSWGQRHVDASRAAVIYSLEPVFGGLIGYAAGEALGASDVVGGAIIVVGVVVASLPGLVLRRPAALLRIRSRARELVGAIGASS